MVSLNEIRELRETLTNHRLEHELLVTKMQVLRQECKEIRERVANRTTRRLQSLTGNPDHGQVALRGIRSDT